MFNTKSPILIGVTVKQGILKVGTPLCLPDKDNMKIGKVVALQHNSKDIQSAKAATGAVTIKIEGDSSIVFGRHFDDTHTIVSKITRDSIDTLKQFFKEEMGKDDWKLVIQLKKIFGLP